jgi:hypothetical protein
MKVTNILTYHNNKFITAVKYFIVKAALGVKVLVTFLFIAGTSDK